MFNALLVLLIIALGVLLIAGAVMAARTEGRPAPVAADPVPQNPVTDEDRRYLAETWRRVEGIFPQDPVVALDIAYKTFASVFRTRGLDVSPLPVPPADPLSVSTEELRQRLLQYEHVLDQLTGMTSPAPDSTRAGESSEVR